MTEETQNPWHIRKTCENPKCEMKQIPAKIFLRHIFNSKSCMEYYGTEKYEQMKRVRNSEQRKKKSREKNKAKELAKNREYKAKIKEKNKESNNQKIPFNVNEKHFPNVHEVNLLFIFCRHS